MNNVQPKILVTGANGQLGKELQELAKTNTAFIFRFLSHEEMPVQDNEQVHHIVETIRPDYLINCAAYTAVDKAETEKEQAFLINGEAPGNLADACRVYHCRLLHISTDYVFSGEGNIPYTETDIAKPAGVYGASKLQGEQRALDNDPAAIVIRTSWLYSQFGSNFVKTMLRLFNEKESINVVNDQQGSPTWAAGLATAIVQLISNIESGKIVEGIYHYCDGGITNWFEFATAIKEFSGAACTIHPVATTAYPTTAKRPAWSVLNTGKIARKGIAILPWKMQLQKCLQQLNATATGS